ncbi:hypothetical protein Tco_1245465 [Tanacetum coccineum]
MSNTNNNLQTQTSNALHNAIMEAGGKDRPPMLALGNYNPPYKFKWTEKTVPVAEAEAVQIISRGIDNDIYSTVDACLNACEMWKAIKRLKQGESINVQDLETNLYWEFGKFTSRDGESLESYYSRFYKMMNELVRNQCDVTNHQVNVQFLLQLQPEWKRFVTLVKQSQELKTVSYHKLYDILKQHQNEVNEIRAERGRGGGATSTNKGKAIVNSFTLTYDQEPTMVTEDDKMTNDKEIDKLMALFSLSFKKIYKPTNNNLITSSNTSRENQDNTLRINRGTGYDNQRVVNVAGARENITPCDTESLNDFDKSLHISTLKLYSFLLLLLNLLWLDHVEKNLKLLFSSFQIFVEVVPSTLDTIFSIPFLHPSTSICPTLIIGGIHCLHIIMNLQEILSIVDLYGTVGSPLAKLPPCLDNMTSFSLILMLFDMCLKCLYFLGLSESCVHNRDIKIIDTLEVTFHLIPKTGFIKWMKDLQDCPPELSGIESE